jgi:hypothetical protein
MSANRSLILTRRCPVLAASRPSRSPNQSQVVSMKLICSIFNFVSFFA